MLLVVDLSVFAGVRARWNLSGDMGTGFCQRWKGFIRWCSLQLGSGVWLHSGYM